MTGFEIPQAIAEKITPEPLVECSICHVPFAEAKLENGLCYDCRHPQPMHVPVGWRPEGAAPLEALTDELQLDDTQTEVRRELRAQVKQAADPAPDTWLAHATEAIRRECTRGRTGHDFTEDTILAEIERAGFNRAPGVDVPEGLRFVLQKAISAGWCERTDRKTKGPDGKPRAVYRTKL